MADFRTAPTLGARLQAIRKARGLRSPKDLAELIIGGNVTASIIENIEVGRKVNLDVSQLLNIAKALELPPSYLLAPLGRPNSKVDLTNLSEALREMTAIEFDSWFSNVHESGYRPNSMAERNASDELTALRELASLGRECRRLEIVISTEQEIGGLDTSRIEMRVASLRQEIEKLDSYLSSAGWNLKP